MNEENLCYYSVVRYVPDPIRNEPKNIGVVVVCQQRGFTKGRFSLTRAALDPSSPRHRFLRSVIDSYDLPFSRDARRVFDTTPRSAFDLARLRQLHEESTNLVQFTEPLPAPGEPESLLDEAYKDFVAPRPHGGGVWARAAALQLFRRWFRKWGHEDWVKASPSIAVGGEPPYVFDLGIGNGAWHTLIENASFRNPNPQLPEGRAAWMAYAWRAVSQEIAGRALLFVERVPTGEAEARFRRISHWARDAGVEVHDSDEAPTIASKLAEEIAQAAGDRLI